MAEDLFSTLAQGFPRDPGRTAIETPDGRTWTYGDLVQRSAAFAEALISHGLQPGDRVAAQIEKSPEVLFLYLGCVRAGGVYLPLNTAYTLNELEYFLGDAEPRIVVCGPGVADQVQQLVPASTVVLTLDPRGNGTMRQAADQASGAPFSDVPRGADDLAAILYTSGTTGRSKGAMLTHRNLWSNALALKEAWRFTSDDVLLHALPVYHTHGLFVATNVSLAAGAAIIFLPKFDIDEVFRLLPRATTMMGVPTFYTRMLSDSRLTREATAHMRLFVSGSAPLLADTHRDFQQRTGHAILERYGMTETNMNTSNPYDGERRAGTVGFALPGVEIRITDPETGRVLPDGEIGMIEVRGPNVFKGYWRMPDKTAAELRPDGFFISGDLGMIDDRGYVQIVGRGKDLVITGGFNVYPKEIETEIDAIPGVVESAVFGVPHPDFGEGVTAVVVAKPGSNLTEKQIHDALNGRLAKFKLPKHVFIVDELPRNAMGKVQKAALRDRYKTLYGQP